ncbi:MAG: serine hydrolase [Rickettsiales bacterium]|nr:serine hydrolase [Rickettsiales bacterium]
MTVKETLGKISQDENFNGIIAVTGHDVICNIDGFSVDTPFKTHSVGKIFSGVLMAEILTKGIINKDDLEKKGIELPKEVIDKLKDQPEVLERLSQVSILDAMTHKAGLGDCLDIHLDRLYRGEKSAESMDELVDLVTNNFEGKENYSNDGLLFGGIALQHLYNQKTGENLSYEELLHKLVIAPSKTNISMTKPDGAYHDEYMPEFPSNPAGGHYASLRDFEAFGTYLVERCKDPVFMRMIEDYGSEFYDKERRMIRHLGDFEGNTPEAPGSSTGFGVFLDSGKTITVFSNIDATKNDRDEAKRDYENAKIKGCYGHKFFKELRDSVIEESQLIEPAKAEKKWSEKFPKKAAEAEDLIREKKSWQKILKETSKSKDDSQVR